MAKVMISMPQELLEEFDKAAKSRHKRRSELLKDLVMEFLHQGEIGSFLKKNPQKSIREQIDDLREHTFKMKAGETAEDLIRKMRDSR
ncbi:MAG: ribbon-helix-helix protein, CopG family [Deltaproteobacteria bacterium]|nr:ribbon-helix-helix protein, CopG family [Deltaproteobacteria bacterium]MBI2501333.1 ribbon-helix-helix protein, CopG family [Deltaproteobacteria bacterium]